MNEAYKEVAKRLGKVFVEGVAMSVGAHVATKALRWLEDGGAKNLLDRVRRKPYSRIVKKNEETAK